MDLRLKSEVDKVAKTLKVGEWKKVYGQNAGLEMWATPCHKGCGNGVANWVPKKDMVFICQSCREQEKETGKELQGEIAKLESLRRVAIAKELISKQYGNTRDYDGVFKVIESKLDKPGWFQSANEVLAAAELLRSKINARHQVKMGRWRVDFILPDLKVVLEIDSDYHNDKKRKESDQLKDAAIIANLGPEWEMVRMRDKHLRDNLKQLLPAIKGVIEERKKARTSNKGQLPKRFSNTAI
jgi:very-short-patch-repair endonuclease